MSLLSRDSVKQEIEDLRSRGVSVYGNPEEHASSASFGWLLGKTAENTLAKYIGKRVGWQKIKMNPPDISGRDVDVVVDLSSPYCFQIKSLNFFESDNFGENMIDTVDSVVNEVAKSATENVAYHGRFDQDGRVRSWEIPTDSANVGKIEFGLSHFGRDNLYSKLHRSIQQASEQLAVDHQGRRRNIAAIDIRYFHAVGDNMYYELVVDILNNYDHFSALDAVFLIGYDLFDENRHPATRLIPIGCPNSDRSISPQLHSDLPIQLYSARPFVLPMNMKVKKGWNEMFYLKNGTLYVENTPIFDLF